VETKISNVYQHDAKVIVEIWKQHVADSCKIQRQNPAKSWIKHIEVNVMIEQKIGVIKIPDP
jgi:hypothetical protein